MHVRRGDEVQVMTGTNEGDTGRILHVDLKKGLVVVEGVNRVHKHVRPSQQNPKGGRIQKEAPIQASNVMPLCNNRNCPKSGKPVRVRYKQGADGSKMRVCVKCDGPLGSS